MAFSDHLAAADAVIAEHVCDTGRLLRGDTVLKDPVAVSLERPSEVAPLVDSRGFVRDKPIAWLPFAQVPSLRKGDVIEIEARRWIVSGAPTRPDDGRWWLAQLDDGGPA